MTGAILAIVLGALPLMLTVPVALPIIGLALGLNAVVKERRMDTRRPLQRRLAYVGIVISGISVALILVAIYGRAA